MISLNKQTLDIANLGKQYHLFSSDTPIRAKNSTFSAQRESTDCRIININIIKTTAQISYREIPQTI